MNLLKAEAKKIRGSKVWIPIVLLPIFSVVFGTMNYANNQEILREEWLSLWTQVYLFYGLFFLPGLIGIIGSFLWRGEHRNQALLVLLSSPQRPEKIVAVKSILALALVLISQGLTLITYGLAGSLFSFSKPIPSLLFVYFILASFSSISLISIQSYISLRIKSFAIPVAFALVYSLMGLLAFGKVMDGLNLPGVQFLFAMPSLTIAIDHLPKILLSQADRIGIIISSLLIFLLFAFGQVRVLRNKRK